MTSVIPPPAVSGTLEQARGTIEARGGNHDHERIERIAPHVRQGIAGRPGACRRCRIDRAVRLRAEGREGRRKRGRWCIDRPDLVEPVQRQLRRQLRLPVALPGRQDRLHGVRQHRRRRSAGARLPARPLHASLDQQPRPPDEAHEARRQAWRGQVRGDQLGRGHRHHRQRAEARHRHVR